MKNNFNEFVDFPLLKVCTETIKWDKVFKNGTSKICGRKPLKNLKGYGLPKNFLKAVFHKFYLVHSWILCPKYCTQYLLKVNKGHHNFILSKSLKSLVLLLSLQNRTKNKLEMFFVSCTTFWPNFILILARILRKKLKMLRLRYSYVYDDVIKFTDSPKAQII